MLLYIMVNNFKLRYILFAVHTGEVSMQNVKDFFQETTKLVWSFWSKKKMKISPELETIFLK